MNLKDYLSKKDKTAKGKTKEWLHFCTLEVISGSLWAGDPKDLRQNKLPKLILRS